MSSTSQIDTVRSYHVGCGFGLIFNNTIIIGRITGICPSGEIVTTVPTIDGHRAIEIHLGGLGVAINVADSGPSPRDGLVSSSTYEVTSLVLVSGDPEDCWYRLTRNLSRATQEIALGACQGITPFGLINAHRLNALVADPRGLLHREAAA